MRSPARTLLAVGLLSAFVAPARAGFVVNLDFTAPSGGNTLFGYSGTINANDEIVAGDFFRIYDFAGLVGTPSAPAGWTVLVAKTDSTPPPNVTLTHGDDPAISNLTFTYGGATIVGPTVITGFMGVSTFSSLATKDYVGRVTALDGKDKHDSIGDVAVPTATVPEPTSLALCGLGVVGLAGYARRRGPALT